MPNDPLKIMVSSTVYGSESDLDQIHAILKGYSYDVVMSKNGTVYVPIGVSNEEACLQAVEDCDLFLGIIFPRYGSGITHKEFSKAIELDKPRWFISHHYIEYTRQLMKQFMFDEDGSRNEFEIQRTSVLDSIKVVDMYNEAIQNHLDSDKRRSHWAHPFFKTTETYDFLRTQFSDMGRRIDEINNLNNNE
jgi:hypothetical protein